MMAIGKMRTRITLQTVLQIKDSKSGQVNTSYGTWKNVYAEVTQDISDEGEKSGQVVYTDIKKFRFRYISGVLPTMRIYII
jgi:head-tail adaptor